MVEITNLAGRFGCFLVCVLVIGTMIAFIVEFLRLGKFCALLCGRYVLIQKGSQFDIEPKNINQNIVHTMYSKPGRRYF